MTKADNAGIANRGDRRNTPADAFRALLDRHGYGFQYAVLKRIEELASEWRLWKVDWSIEATEFPVESRGGTTHIDFILLSQKGGAIPVRLVCECKRTNPALFDWCFIRLPHVQSPCDVLLQRLRRFKANSFVRVESVWQSALVYHLGFPVKGSVKGDTGGEGRSVLDEAVAQVMRGTSGLIDFLAKAQDVRHLLRFAGASGYARVAPAIITTAHLWVSEANLAESDLSTGHVPAAPMREVPWLWLRQNISPALRHSLDADARTPRETLSDYLIEDYSITVAIVNALGIGQFLTH